MLPNNDGTYSTRALLATSVASGKLTASTGSVSRSQSGMANQLSNAATVTGVLRTTHIYHDQRKIAMSFQLRDRTSFSVSTLTAKIEVQVVKATDSNILVASSTVTCHQNGRKSASKICHGTVTVPEAYFDNLVTEEEYDVIYQLQSIAKHCHVFIESHSGTQAREDHGRYR